MDFDFLVCNSLLENFCICMKYKDLDKANKFL